MSEHKLPPDDQVESLVRAYLERQEATVDPAQVLAGVKAKQEVRSQESGVRSQGSGGRSQESGKRSRSMRRWAWSMAAAAGILLAMLATLQLGPGEASAQTLIVQAQQAHSLDIDRCYRIEIEPSKDVLDQFPLVATGLRNDLIERFPLLAPGNRQEVLWTRGDRFWIETSHPERNWAWGQDGDGRVWLAPTRDQGIYFEPNEVPDFLAGGLAVRSVHFETLLKEVLQDFDLVREHAERASIYRVRAVPRPDLRHPTLGSAVIDLDPDTKVVQRLVLQRTFRGQDVARVTFTLVETGQQPDDAYELKGHLDPEARVFGPERRRERLQVLAEHLGLHFGPQLRNRVRAMLKKML